MSVLVGMFVTTIIQSSSATTVMVVGFVNAGLMTLAQAVGVVFEQTSERRLQGKWFPLTCHNGHLSSSLLV